MVPESEEKKFLLHTVLTNPVVHIPQKLLLLAPSISYETLIHIFLCTAEAIYSNSISSLQARKKGGAI
jgi:hypothetical protein